MDQLLFTEVCSEMAYLDFLGSGSLASLLPPCCLHSAGLEAQIDVLFHLSSVISRQISDIQVQIVSELGGGYKKTKC